MHGNFSDTIVSNNGDTNEVESKSTRNMAFFNIAKKSI